MKSSGPVYKSPVANSVPFDNSTNGFTADNTQTAIEELKNSSALSVSPGFTWGYRGTVTPGTYLENDGVPSNVAGRVVPLTSGNIVEIFVTNELVTTYSLDIQKNIGGVYTTLTTVTVSAARNAVFSVSVAVAKFDELCVRISPTSANNPKNVDVGVIIKGTV